MNNFLKRVLLNIVPITCTIITFWQSGKCFFKFMEEPKGTHLSIEFNGDQPLFPTITICNRQHEVWTNLIYNQTVLKSCNISSIQEYKMGNWVGNCSDPKTLFEKAVAKSDQIIELVNYVTVLGQKLEKNVEETQGILDLNFPTH